RASSMCDAATPCWWSMPANARRGSRPCVSSCRWRAPRRSAATPPATPPRWRGCAPWSRGCGPPPPRATRPGPSRPPSPRCRWRHSCPRSAPRWTSCACSAGARSVTTRQCEHGRDIRAATVAATLETAMNLFRNLLVWILLAIIGALAWHLLAQDPGYVLVRYRGWDYTTNLLWVSVAVVATLLVLWLLWALVATPLRALRRRRERQSRERLGAGLEALHRGHYARAEKLLPQATDGSDAAVARLAAARAALARGDHAAARSHLDAIDADHALTRAIGRAELALAEDRPTDALVALDDPAAQPLSPRGLALRADALAASRQAADADARLGARRRQQALPEAALAQRERDWAAQSLAEAEDGNALAARWESMPKALRAEPRVVAAYAGRAAGLGWDEAAVSSLGQ